MDINAVLAEEGLQFIGFMCDADKRNTDAAMVNENPVIKLISDFIMGSPNGFVETMHSFTIEDMINHYEREVKPYEQVSMA